MRVIGTGVDLQLFEHVPSQFILWQHATDGVVDQVFGLAGLAVAIAFQPQTGVPGIPGVVPDVHFLARHGDLFGVQHDHEVATIDVRRVLGPVLAHQDDRDVAGQTPQDFVVSVDDKPIFFDFARLGDVSSLSNHYQATAGG